MKKNYNKPVLEVESFVTEEIMETFNPENVLSYGPTATDAGGYNGSNFINFNKVNGNLPDNALNSVDYSTFTH